MPSHALVARSLIVGLLVGAAPAHAQDVGQVKVARGTVHVERGSQRLTAPVGFRVREADVLVTGADGALGITFDDNTLLSLGPGSSMVIERFAFDATTHQGTFESSLRKGTLAGISGKLAKQSPDAMKVRTPTALLGVRGTEFVVRVAEAGE